MSLTFGGRRLVGHGFGIPLVVRYLLETCATVPAAVEALERLPFHLAHNLTMVDRDGRVATAYLAPERRPVITDAAVATNHQHVADWPEYATMTRSHEREALIGALLDDPAVTAESFVAAFLVPPLLDTAGPGHFGTLYTAVLRPGEGAVDYCWPARTWRETIAAGDPDAVVELPAEVASA